MKYPNDTAMAVVRLGRAQFHLRSLEHGADGVALTAEHLPELFRLLDAIDARIAHWQHARADAWRAQQAAADDAERRTRDRRADPDRREYQRRANGAGLHLVEDIPA